MLKDILVELQYHLGYGRENFEGEVKPEHVQKLQDFLIRNQQAIRAMRTLHQVGDGQIMLPAEDIKDLRELVENSSHGELSWVQGSLCEIGNRWEEFQHNGSCFHGDLRQIQTIRGFWFYFKIDDLLFECVDLDGGKSRAYFDSLSDEGKKLFILRFGYRNDYGINVRDRDFGYYLEPRSKPVRFTSFVSLDHQGKFNIEKTVGIKPLISL